MLRPDFRTDFVTWGQDSAKYLAVDATVLPVLATVVSGKGVY